MRPTLTTAQFHKLAGRIAEYSGFTLDGGRHRSLESALAVRMEALDVTETRAYLHQLDERELHRLTELVVNHETQFFRTPAHHRALRSQVLTTLHESKPVTMPLRCWSAGCATGEEPYSLAITTLDVLGEPLPRPVEIYATDISTQALAKAQAATYRGRTLTNVSPDQLRQRFELEQNMYTVRPDVRSLVKFEQHNLHAALPRWAHNLDIISCQNVTIYFSVEVCRALMQRFWDVLAPGGFLFLGYSETLWRIFDRFETVEIAGAFVYRKPAPHSTLSKPRIPVQRRATRELRAPAAPRRPHKPMSATPTLSAPMLLEQGLAQFRAGALDAALATLGQIKQDAPAFPQALATIARIHADRGAWEQAIAEARRAIELDVLTLDAHLLLGMLAANGERWIEAVQHLERVRYLEPQAPLPSFHLANAYRGQGRFDLADREYRSALRKLANLDAAAMLDGVTVAWLRETCQRYLHQLEADRLQPR